MNDTCSIFKYVCWVGVNIVWGTTYYVNKTNVSYTCLHKLLKKVKQLSWDHCAFIIKIIWLVSNEHFQNIFSVLSRDNTPWLGKSAEIRLKTRQDCLDSCHYRIIHTCFHPYSKVISLILHNFRQGEEKVFFRNYMKRSNNFD